MSTNGINCTEDVDTNECDGEKVVTMMDVLQEQEEFEEDANAVLGASDDKNCTYPKGYIKRQAIYACLTCCDEARSDPSNRAGVCLACSLTCHENHELIELYTKRNFRCDCGNPNFNSHPCQFMSNKTELNEDNKYNQNFSGLYCVCHRPYPDPENPIEDEMIQCIICEDWLHSAHLEAIVPTNEQYAEMICKECMERNEFLHDYSDFAVNTESTEVDIITSNGTGVTATDVNTECNKSQNQVLFNGTTASTETNNDKENKEEMDVDSSIKETIEAEMINENVCVKESNEEVNEENVNEKEDSSDKTQESINKPQETSLEADNIGETNTSGKEDNTEKLDIINTEADPNSSELTEPDVIQASNGEPSDNGSVENISDNINGDSNEPEKINTLNVNANESSDLPSEFESNTVSEKDIEHFEKATTEKVLESEVDKSNIDYENNKEHNENSKETEELVSNDSKDDEKGQANDNQTNENIEMETCESKAMSPGKSVLDSVDEPKLDSVDEPKLDSVDEPKLDSVDEPKLDSTDEPKLDSTDESNLNSVEEPISDSINKSKLNSVDELETLDESNKVNDNEKHMESTEPTSTENVDIEMKDDNASDKVEARDIDSNLTSMPLESEVATHKEAESESAAVENINVSEAESLSTKNEDELKSVTAAKSGTETAVGENETESAAVENEVTLNTGDQSSDKNFQELKDSEVLPNIQENKRKLSTEQSDAEANMPKKAKLEEAKQCVRPRHIERRFKGATFWPSNFRQKLCTCNECISMYKDLSVLFLIDPEDTVTAYETLGKEKINGAAASQYEKGLEALSSLDRIQQINALTEYNKMRDKLLDFLKSFKDRKEIVKEEDIKAFFAGMKPKREPDGVYFCR